MSDVGEGPDIRQPGLDLLIIPGGAAVDDDLSMPPALVDGGLRPRLDCLAKLELTVLYPELMGEYSSKKSLFLLHWDFVICHL